MKDHDVGFLLYVIPGLLGLLGVGDLYLGNWIIGKGFLMWSAVLYIALLLTLAIPGLAFLEEYVSAGWAVGYSLTLIESSLG